MKTRVLKNPTRKNLKTIFRGRTIEFRPKHSKIFDWEDEEKRAEYAHWITIYGFCYDITERLEITRRLEEKKRGEQNGK